MDRELNMEPKLRDLRTYLMDNVNVNRDNFAEMLEGALGENAGEHFRYHTKGPRERLGYALDRTSSPVVWKTLRLGLLLNGYTEEWEAVNQRLPACDSPDEEPATWTLPLTSIRRYLIQTVDPRRGEMRRRMADALYKDPPARAAFKSGKLDRRKLMEIVMDSLDRPEVLDAFRRSLRVSGQRDVADAVDRALSVENAYLRRVNQAPVASRHRPL